MRTTRLLNVFRSIQGGGSVCLGGDVCLGVSVYGMYPSMQWGRHHPLWTEWQTDVKNITLSQTSFAGGKNLSVYFQWDFRL